MTALLFAARQNDMKSAALLIAAGADINETAQDGTNPILVAVMNGHYALANFLLGKRRGPERGRRQGPSGAVRRGGYAQSGIVVGNIPPEKDPMTDMELINALLAHGANPNARLTKKIPLRGQPSFDGDGRT